MADDILLGSQVRILTKVSMIEGILVMRQERRPGLPMRISVQMTDSVTADHSVVLSKDEDVRIELIREPAHNAVLVIFGVGTVIERVRHIASSRLEALDWLRHNRSDWPVRRDIAIRSAWPDRHAWRSPLPLQLVPDWDSEGFRNMPDGCTGIPVGGEHPGAFGFRRRHHVHEGVDIYAPEGTPVTAMEEGTVTAIAPFTGSISSPPTPFWNDTWAVTVEGISGSVVYGEVDDIRVSLGERIATGTMIGSVRQVLVKEKSPPRPMAMLHIELHHHGTTDTYEWPVDGERPPTLLDPTEMLLSAAFDR